MERRRGRNGTKPLSGKSDRLPVLQGSILQPLKDGDNNEDAEYKRGIGRMPSAIWFMLRRRLGRR